MSTADTRIAASGLAEELDFRRLGIRIATLALSVPMIGLLVGGVITERQNLSWAEICVWAAALGLLNLMEIPGWRGLRLAPDLPLAVGAAVLLPPVAAALIGFFGTLDARELRGQTPIVRSMFNRSQQALSFGLASAAVGALHLRGGSLAQMVLAAGLAILVITVVNYVVVAFGLSVLTHDPIRHLLKHLTLGTPQDFALTWAAWGLMALMLVAAYDVLGPWAVIIFALIALLGRQVLLRSESNLRWQADIEAKQVALREIANRIEDERADERNRIAAHLHDEVLQPLHQVMLLSRVVQQDLEGAHLLEIDKDVPLLRSACDISAENVRSMIRTLRTSPSGLRGLNSTLRGLVRDLQNQSRARVQAHFDNLGEMEPGLQLIIYQVAKEALANAVRHSRADEINLHLSREGNTMRLSVEDNGIGFDTHVDYHDHFGLLIMKERAETAGGVLHVESWVGEGTIVAGRFPIPAE
jgi:signal transduction histidine kinase